MYERSAIVLERYFNSILGYSSENNLKVNFENYCNLVEKLDEFQNAYTQEQTAIQDFNDVTENIKSVQKSQERAYKKSVKLEFNRNLLFNNIEEKTEDTENCIIKIESDIDKNNETQKGLREKFIALVNEYNEKKAFLNSSKKDRKTAEKSYNEIFKIAEENAKNINEFNLEFARNFTGTEIKEKLVALMLENGKGEKVSFDEGVINSAADLGLDIAQREVACYVDMYDNIMRLFDEIANDCIKLDKFKKRMRNVKVKLNFLFAEKEYLFQFLDYERITAVNGKKAHKKLMNEACENFKADIAQINNLYELILREIATKSTKKGYKELYNKSYLLDIKQEEAKFKKEKNRVNLNAGTILNSNYWRIEGIKNIYTVFYEDISNVFGRDLVEFDIPEEQEENFEEIIEDSAINALEEITGIEKVEQEKVSMFENSLSEMSENEVPQKIFEDEIEPNSNVEENIEETQETKKEEFDIFGKYENIETNIAKIINKSHIEEMQDSEEIGFEERTDVEEIDDLKDVSKIESEENVYEEESYEDFAEEDIPYEQDEEMYEPEEESLFGNMKESRKTKSSNINLEMIEEFEQAKKSKSSKKGILKSLIKMNSKNKKKVTN